METVYIEPFPVPCSAQNDIHHKYLCLLTAIELILNRNSYDTGKSDNNFINDIRIVTSSYRKLVGDALKDGEYSEMGHIYALSAALQIPIKSYFPPCAQEELSSAFCKLVCARDVNCMEAFVHVMWTSTCVPVSKEKLSINHFVPLVKSSHVREFAADCNSL